MDNLVASLCKSLTSYQCTTHHGKDPYQSILLCSFSARYVDEKLQYSLNFKYKKILKHHPNAIDKLKFWNPELCASQPMLFDFIITVRIHPFSILKANANKEIWMTEWVMTNFILTFLP